MLEPVIHEDRVRGAASIRGTSAKDNKIREKILAGLADDHPSVRVHADNREFARLTPTERWRLEQRLTS